MVDIDRWVKRESEQMLFIYGENDPWGAEPFVDSGKDSATFVAPGAYHGATIAALRPEDAEAATAMLQRWAGVEHNSARTLRAGGTMPPMRGHDGRERREPRPALMP